MTEKKLIALYARVSTDKQAVDMQTSELKDFIKRRDWKIYKAYIDQGYSGKNTKRPAFNEMMDHARDRRFDILMVWKLDRLGRSLKDLINILDELASFGVDFISYKDRHMDTTTPTGKLVFNVVASVAEFERDLISERVKAGLANAVRKGKTLGAKRKLTPLLFQRGLEMKAQGMSNRQIAKKLNISEGAFRYWLKK
jgi:DNA invertase Pin-like site-specific DNA recombinase